MSELNRKIDYTPTIKDLASGSKMTMHIAPVNGGRLTKYDFVKIDDTDLLFAVQRMNNLPVAGEALRFSSEEDPDPQLFRSGEVLKFHSTEDASARKDAPARLVLGILKEMTITEKRNSLRRRG